MAAAAFASTCSMTAVGGSSPPAEPAPRRRQRPTRSRRPRRPAGSAPRTLAQRYRESANVPEESLLVGGESVFAPEQRRFARSSRFPSNWGDAVRQLTVAVSLAHREGYERLRVDVRSPELVAHDGSAPADRLTLMMGACNAVLAALLFNREAFAAAAGTPDPNPARAALFFNSRSEAARGAALLSPQLRPSVDIHVLGEGQEAAAATCNVAVVLCPRNTDGNPAHIEHVEIVHYSNWNRQNLVLMFNPSLIALTRHGSLDDEPRPPSFLSDYHPSYYIDPVAYMCKNATGAVLRCFPRKWEMYLHRAKSEGGFRLIAEQDARPSREKLKCEFSWRAEISSERPVE